MKTTFAPLLLVALLGFGPALVASPDGAPPEKEPLKSEKKEDAPKKDEKPIVIPFELLKSRHMAIQVKINGKGPYRFIFDTGAPTNLVNNKTAKESGILDKNKKEPTGFFGAAMTSKSIKKLELGDLVLEGMPTMVVDHPTVAAISEAVGGVEGLIGYPFFGRYKMTIDYQKKEMTLVPSGHEPGDTMQAMMNKLMMAGSGKKADATVLAPAGVWGFTVDKEEKDEDDGVKVTKVLPNSPAADGGLQEGDRLLTLDSRWTDSVSDTFFATSVVKPGKAVALVVKRDGKEVKLKVTPGKGL